MSNEIQQITPFDGYGSDVVEYGGRGAMVPAQQQQMPLGDAAQPQQGALMKKIHQSLRGRYCMSLVFGVVLGVVG